MELHLKYLDYWEGGTKEWRPSLITNDGMSATAMSGNDMSTQWTSPFHLPQKNMNILDLVPSNVTSLWQVEVWHRELMIVLYIRNVEEEEMKGGTWKFNPPRRSNRGHPWRCLWFDSWEQRIWVPAGMADERQGYEIDLPLSTSWLITTPLLAIVSNNPLWWEML